MLADASRARVRVDCVRRRPPTRSQPAAAADTAADASDAGALEPVLVPEPEPVDAAPPSKSPPFAARQPPHSGARRVHSRPVTNLHSARRRAPVARARRAGDAGARPVVDGGLPNREPRTGAPAPDAPAAPDMTTPAVTPAAIQAARSAPRDPRASARRRGGNAAHTRDDMATSEIHASVRAVPPPAAGTPARPAHALAPATDAASAAPPTASRPVPLHAPAPPADRPLPLSPYNRVRLRYMCIDVDPLSLGAPACGTRVSTGRTEAEHAAGEPDRGTVASEAADATGEPGRTKAEHGIAAGPPDRGAVASEAAGSVGEAGRAKSAREVGEGPPDSGRDDAADVTDAAPRRPQRGATVDVWWEDRGEAYRGRVTQRAHGCGRHACVVRYDDGDVLVVDFDDVHWRRVDAAAVGAWVEPGQLSEAARERGDRGYKADLRAPGARAPDAPGARLRSRGKPADADAADVDDGVAAERPAGSRTSRRRRGAASGPHGTERVAGAEADRSASVEVRDGRGASAAPLDMEDVMPTIANYAAAPMERRPGNSSDAWDQLRGSTLPKLKRHKMPLVGKSFV